MRKLFLISLLFLTGFAALAQGLSSQDHLLFKGIPIDGEPTKVCRSLQDQGFSLLGSRDGIIGLTGRFAGFDGSVISILSDEGCVWKVVVDFTGHDNWSSVKRQYELFKKSYVKKYGVEPVCSEFFPNYVQEGSGREASAFRDETGEWQSVFQLGSGSVVMSVRPVVSGPGKLFLRLEYIDEFNSFMHDNALMNDI